MNKLTIFFIGATVLVIGITGTLLGYKYFERQEEQAPAQEIQEDETDNQPIVTDITEPPVIEEDIDEEETDSPLIAVLANIDLEKILEEEPEIKFCKAP